MLHLTQWPESVQIYHVVFPVVWAELEDCQGTMSYEPEPGGTVQIQIASKFQDTDYAWLVLFHEMTHAALAVSGTGEMIASGPAEEAIVCATEAVWRGLVAAGGKQTSGERTSRGRGGRTAGQKSNPRARRRGRS